MNNSEDRPCPINISDVGGKGVQVAFIATTTITIAAVVVAYLLDALDDDQLNFVDRRVIAQIQTKCAIFKKYLLGNDEGLERRASCTSRDDINELWEVRKEAICRFILAVSDTQLVTGLAILFAGIFNRKNITVYELHIILSQAWLASTTHLATLDALRNHLRSYGIVRDVRVACMTIMQLLLVAAFCIIQVDWDWCAFVEPQKESSESRPYSRGKKFNVNNAAWIAVLLIIFANYFIRIQDLYVKHRHAIYLPSSLVSRVKRHPRFTSSHSQRFSEVVAEARRRRIFRIMRSSGLTRIFLNAVHGFENSFLSSMPWVLFFLVYGITWVINITSKRMQKSIDVRTHGTKMNYGQIMSVLLLLLPILAAGSTYYEYRNKLGRTLTVIERRRGSSQGSTGTSNATDDMRIMILQQEHFRRDVFHQLLPTEDRYEISVPRIQKYFYANVQTLRRHVPYITPEERLCREQKILDMYAEVEELEKEVGVAPAVVVFSVQTLLMILLAIIINVGWMGSSSTMIVAAYIFLCVVGCQILWAAYEFIELATTRSTM